MKVSWDGFARLIKTFQQNKGEIAPRQTAGWISGKGLCHGNAPVQKEGCSLPSGEDDRHHFKASGPGLEPVTPEEDRLVQSLALIVDGDKEAPLPLLVRTYKKKEGNTERGQGPGAHILEFIVETEKLGIVIIRIIKQAGVYTGRLLLESGDAGKIIEQELSGLQEAITFALQGKNINLRLLRWGAIPILDLQEIKKEMHKFSYMLDQKV